ncbi:hypothetical protein HDR63_01045 [bacterium]|nr:hypothetical protein [bacterium]
MWKTFFNTLYFLSHLIPLRGMRRWVQHDKLFDYGAKRAALRATCPDLDWPHMRLAKGGGSLAFIFDRNQCVFKVRKHYETDNSDERFAREKRITDAIAPIVPVRVPHIDLIQAGPFLFYKSDFIPGRVLVDLPLKKIRAHREKIGAQLGRVIFSLFNADLAQLSDMRKPNAGDDYGMTHGDMCSNIIVNPDTMDVVGIIDWEYAGFRSLKDEFTGLFRVRRKMRQTDIAPEAMWTYYTLKQAPRKKTK